MAAARLPGAEVLGGGTVDTEIDWEEDARSQLEGSLATAAEGSSSVQTSGLPREFGAPADVLCDLAAHLEASLIASSATAA